MSRQIILLLFFRHYTNEQVNKYIRYIHLLFDRILFDNCIETLSETMIFEKLGWSINPFDRILAIHNYIDI